MKVLLPSIPIIEYVLNCIYHSLRCFTRIEYFAKLRGCNCVHCQLNSRRRWLSLPTSDGWFTGLQTASIFFGSFSILSVYILSLFSPKMISSFLFTIFTLSGPCFEMRKRQSTTFNSFDQWMACLLPIQYWPIESGLSRLLFEDAIFHHFTHIFVSFLRLLSSSILFDTYNHLIQEKHRRREKKIKKITIHKNLYVSVSFQYTRTLVSTTNEWTAASTLTRTRIRTPKHLVCNLVNDFFTFSFDEEFVFFFRNCEILLVFTNQSHKSTFRSIQSSQLPFSFDSNRLCISPTW